MYATHFHQPQTQVDQQGLLPAFMESFGNLTLGDANEQGPVSSTVRAAVQVIPTPTVFLSRLAPTCSETQLTSLGAPFGMVKSARFVPKDGEGKSYGFIMFGSPSQAQACIIGLSEKGYKCGFARETLKEKLERLSDPFETNLYVKNLPPGYTQEALEHLFIPNVVVSSKMLESHNSVAEGKGVALVRLQSREEAHLMVDKLHGQILPGASAPLVVRFADNPAQKTVREEAARVKKLSQMREGEWSPEVESQWGSPQTPTSPPYMGTYGRLSYNYNPYFTAQLNYATQQLASQGPPMLSGTQSPRHMGSPHVAPFVPSSQRPGAFKHMVGQPIPGLPNGASAGVAYGLQPGGQPLGLGLTGPFVKQDNFHKQQEVGVGGGEEYGLRW